MQIFFKKIKIKGRITILMMNVKEKAAFPKPSSPTQGNPSCLTEWDGRLSSRSAAEEEKGGKARGAVQAVSGGCFGARVRRIGR